ncbi:MAG: hypothetical protein FIB01_04400, partial [Gemmatimonadetes bacterium]|nr:hypothetical protein [Gemmatimonadota bacterium]
MSLAAGGGIVGLYRHARYHVPCWNHRCPRFGSCQAPPPDCLDHDRTGRLPVFLVAAVALAALVPMTAAWT